jgi:hypothetical protein
MWTLLLIGRKIRMLMLEGIGKRRRKKRNNLKRL